MYCVLEHNTFKQRLMKGTKKEIDVPEAIVELVYTKGQDKFPDKAIQVR